MALHDELKRIATSEDGEGEPVALVAATKVVGVDSEEGVVKLEGGEEVRGDVVVGADGIYVGDICWVIFFDCFMGGFANSDTVHDEKVHQRHPTDSHWKSGIPIHDTSFKGRNRRHDGTTRRSHGCYDHLVWR